MNSSSNDGSGELRVQITVKWAAKSMCRLKLAVEWCEKVDENREEKPSRENLRENFSRRAKEIFFSHSWQKEKCCAKRDKATWNINSIKNTSRRVQVEWAANFRHFSFSKYRHFSFGILVCPLRWRLAVYVSCKKRREKSMKIRQEGESGAHRVLEKYMLLD